MFQLAVVLMVSAVRTESVETVKWITTATDQSKKFELQSPLIAIDGSPSDSIIVTVDENVKYQNIYGFGAAVTC